MYFQARIFALKKSNQSHKISWFMLLIADKSLSDTPSTDGANECIFCTSLDLEGIYIFICLLYVGEKDCSHITPRHSRAVE